MVKNNEKRPILMIHLAQMLLRKILVVRRYTQSRIVSVVQRAYVLAFGENTNINQAKLIQILPFFICLIQRFMWIFKKLKS